MMTKELLHATKVNNVYQITTLLGFNSDTGGKQHTQQA